MVIIFVILGIILIIISFLFIFCSKVIASREAKLRRKNFHIAQRKMEKMELKDTRIISSLMGSSDKYNKIHSDRAYHLSYIIVGIILFIAGIISLMAGIFFRYII